jgi:hypothetical protein
VQQALIRSRLVRSVLLAAVATGPTGLRAGTRPVAVGSDPRRDRHNRLVAANRADRSGTRHAAGGITSQTLTTTTTGIIAAESSWDHEPVNGRRVPLWCQDPATAPHDGGVLVDTGDRKDATATAHVARQSLGSVGKVDNGIVAVTSLWADGRCSGQSVRCLHAGLPAGQGQAR